MNKHKLRKLSLKYDKFDYICDKCRAYIYERSLTDQTLQGQWIIVKEGDDLLYYEWEWYNGKYVFRSVYDCKYSDEEWLVKEVLE